jgi:hypothetical protein
MTFCKWIEKHKDKETPLGDLARDISHLRANHAGDVIDFTKLPPMSKRNTLQAYRDHLRRWGACEEAQETLTHAWNLYEIDEGKWIYHAHREVAQ